DRPMKPAVTPEQLHDSFKACLNPPELVPDHFDADPHEIVSALANTIPKHMQDHTPQGFFSRRITEDDIKRIKVKLRKRSYCSAQGINAVSYSRIMTIPNEVLVELFHACLDITVECYLLKVLTLLFDERLHEWAEANRVIPDSQNSFRPGYRTEDNCFILICAIARACAESKPLYVFFGDMTNMFPYTDVGRLWADMYATGVSGPFFD
ncbi:hypothetical protein B0H10DRAFT_1682584, partial [Mycena sp. CBHHK59/15]